MYITRAMAGALLGTALAFAAPSQVLAASHQAAGPDTKAEKPEKSRKPAAAATRRHVGTLKAVDSASGTLTVTEKGGDAAVSVSDKTAVKKGKESLQLSDLKPGDEVTVVYVKQDGKDVARSVTVKP